LKEGSRWKNDSLYQLTKYVPTNQEEEIWILVEEGSSNIWSKPAANALDAFAGNFKDFEFVK
jgi:hypothetical protein